MQSLVKIKFRDLSLQEDERKLLERNRIFSFWVRTPTASHLQFDCSNQHKSNLLDELTNRPTLEPK